MNHTFNVAHQNLCGEAVEMKGKIQDAFQAVFGNLEDSHRLGALLTALGNAIYDIEDLEYTVLDYARKCRNKSVYVVILDLQTFVEAVTDLVELLEDSLDQILDSSTNPREVIQACDQVRTAAANLKFIRTPIRPEPNELCFNDQD